jgi:CubicO group peptidase (beta-lactamase class C family)
MSRRLDGASALQGTAAAGFEAVADAFAASIAEVGEGGAAFAAVVDGNLVVDLWGGRAGALPWSHDTRAVLMSTTKGVVATVVARLVERGEIDVEAPVARYWPEFAAGGKGDVTVAQLLSHTAGLVTVPGYETFMRPHGGGWDRTDEIVRRLAEATPRWTPGTAIGYHGITFGWLTGELVRRVTGRTTGAILREEIAGPLQLELDLGTPRVRQQLVAPVVQPPGDEPIAPEVEALLASPAWSDMILAIDGRSLITEATAFFADPAILALELGGSNATGTARALAVLYGTLAVGGERDGVHILASENIALVSAERIAGIDCVHHGPSRYGLGFARPLPEPGDTFAWGPHDEAFGHGGHGGQIAFADPVGRVGIGFVRSHLSLTSPLGPRLVEALYDCL